MSDVDYFRDRKSKYCSPDPYPKIRVTAPNLGYAEILMDDYAGVVSEFTAVSQYFYHHMFFEDVNKELGHLLEEISIVEMHHLEMLGDTIKLLGGNPMLRGSYSTNGNFWNGQLVYYGMGLCDRIRADIDSEYKAIENYNRHIAIINDPYVQEILRRIVKDEKVHIKFFEEAIKKYASGCI